VTAIGQGDGAEGHAPLLGVPDDLSIIDISASALRRRRLTSVEERSRRDPQLDRFDMKQFMTLDQIGEWIRETRTSHVRDESKID